MQLRVPSDGWHTWNFADRLRGPVVPEGTYDVKRVETVTGRPAIVLADPRVVGAGDRVMIGEDEGHLRADKESMVDLIV